MSDRGPLALLLTEDELRRALSDSRSASESEYPLDSGSWHPALPDRVGASVEYAAVAAAVDGRLDQPWPQLTATMFRRFQVDGDRRAYETSYFARRDRITESALSYALTGSLLQNPAQGAGQKLGEPGFGKCSESPSAALTDVVDGIWLLCEETTWCLPAHQGSGLPDPAAPVLDLFAAETGAQLTYLDVLLGSDLDQVDPAIRSRIRREVRSRVIEPYLTREYWWYSLKTGQAGNWNTWINSNVLVAALRFSSSAAERVTLVRRVLEGLDNYLAHCPEDGGCTEGAAYWWHGPASLFQACETLYRATRGRFDPFQLPLLRRIARYPLLTAIGPGWECNFADGPARPKPHAVNPWLLYRYGAAVADPEVMAHARAIGAGLTPLGEGGPLGRVLAALATNMRADLEPQAAPETALSTKTALPPETAVVSDGRAYPRQEWLPQTQVLVARELGGSAAGLCLAAKGGHNAEDHNHNDIGSFIIAHHGQPVIIDVGVGVYTKTTFSDDRYQIWCLNSAYHNVPQIDGCDQYPASEATATAVSCALTPDRAVLTMDLAAAYPAAAGVSSWRRELRLDRVSTAVEPKAKSRITITDSWCLLREPSDLALHLMTAVRPESVAPGILTIGPLTVRLGQCAIAIDEIQLDDVELCRVWGSTVWRIRLALPTTSSTGEHRMVVEANS